MHFEEHMNRLTSSAPVIGLEMQLEYNQVYEYCNELILSNGVNDCGIRITYSKGTQGNSLIITSRENPYTVEMMDNGFSLMTSNIMRNETSPIVGIKSNNYLDNLLSLNDAKERGFNEALFYNSKAYLAEGTMSNIFFVKNDKILTPAVKNGLLSGIMRDKVIHLAKDLGMLIEEGCYKKNELFSADEIFVTNSLMDIMPVKLLDSKEFKIKDDSITRYLIEKYRNYNY